MSMYEGSKYLSFFLGGCSVIMLLVATIHPEWKKNSEVSSSGHVGTIFICEGMWYRCSSETKGEFICDSYGESYIALDAGIQACRGLMVVACIASFFGVIGNLLCLDCTTLLPSGTKSKRNLAIISGFNLLGAALCTLGATAFYAWQVTYQFYNPYYQEREFKYEYGACLYVAWVSMVLSLIAALILIIGSCREKDSYEPYRYRQSQMGPRSPAYDTKEADNRTEYV